MFWKKKIIPKESLNPFDLNHKFYWEINAVENPGNIRTFELGKFNNKCFSVEFQEPFFNRFHVRISQHSYYDQSLVLRTDKEGLTDGIFQLMNNAYEKVENSTICDFKLFKKKYKGKNEFLLNTFNQARLLLFENVNYANNKKQVYIRDIPYQNIITSLEYLFETLNRSQLAHCNYYDLYNVKNYIDLASKELVEFLSTYSSNLDNAKTNDCTNDCTSKEAKEFKNEFFYFLKLEVNRLEKELEFERK